MFVDVQVPRQDLTDLAAVDYDRTGFLGVYFPNRQWDGDPTITRREPAIWFHTHWHEDILGHPFTADWATHLETAEAGEYSFEVVTSGPTTVSFDRRIVFTTSAVDNPAPQQFSVTATAGRHLLVVSYREASSRAMVALSWRPPHQKTEVIPLAALTPLSAEEYAQLRPTLPRPSGPD
jgi:hypothetical protein